jgi:hypothetical protein
MLGSITPLGQRGRRSGWGPTVVAYVAASTLAGSALGLALGFAGRSGPLKAGGSGRIWLLAAVVALGIVFDLGPSRALLPTVHRQVNEDWLTRYRGWVYGVGFGAQLGLGVVTIVTASAVYATFVAALLTGSTGAGAAIGGAFGFARAAAVLPAGAVRRPDQLAAIDARLGRWDRPSRRVAAGVQAVLAVAAAVAALVPGVGR